MKAFPLALADRFLDYASGTLRLTGKLHRTMAGRYVADQLMRAGASCGANYQEATGAESRADFVHKLQLVLKELRESLYWLRLIERGSPGLATDVAPLLKEGDELTRIVAKSVVTAKSGGKQT